MKKVRYLFMGLLVSVLGVSLVEAAGEPKFNIDVTPTVNEDNTVNIKVVVKNDGTSSYGMKDGKVYINLDSNLIKRATNLAGGNFLSGIFKDYNETTDQYTESNVTCSYNGTEHQVICIYGKDTTSLVAYSGPKDEFEFEFKTELCAGSNDCQISVKVEGQAIDEDGATTRVEATKNANCISNTPIDPGNSNNGTPNEPIENPNTVDNGIIYMLVGTLSLVLIMTVLTVNKKRRA